MILNGRRITMAKRIYSEIPKFKKVEASLRVVANSFRPVLHEIDAALAGPRKPDEEALLRTIRDQTIKARDHTMQVLHQLYVEVDESCKK
jgi:hypothetical protein